MEDMPNSQPEQTSKRSRTADARSIRSQSQSFNEQKLRSPRPRSLNRSNKLYRTPRTPPPEIQFDREQSFILDCKAVSNISNDYSTANPKLGSVIPPYDSQLDPHTQSYYQFFGVPRTLARAGQAINHESLAGKVHDRFYASGHGFRYLSLRNKSGAGHSIEEVRGHELFLSNPQPVLNYNGLFGYRRNNPSLRRQPSIGTTTIGNRAIVPFGRFSTIGCGKPYAFHCRCKFDQPCRCHNQNELCPCVKT